MENIFGTGTPASQKAWQYWLFKQFHYRFKWKNFKKNGKLELPYPVAGSYADVLIITKETVREFCRYCGIMAAAGLFVEIAIPTALLLSSKKIVQQKDSRLQGTALWSATENEAVEETYRRSLSALLTGFPEKQLFYHPIKLSKWKNDL